MKNNILSLLLIVSSLLLAYYSKVGAEGQDFRKLAVNRVTDAVYELYSNSKRSTTDSTISKEEFKTEYVSYFGELPTIFHSVGLYVVSSFYMTELRHTVCSVSDSTFEFELRGDRSYHDTLKLSETLTMLNYFVKAEGPREYTSAELISILELGLNLQAILMDPDWRTYPKVLTEDDIAWSELEVHITASDPVDDSVTSSRKGRVLAALLSSEFDQWLDFEQSMIQRPSVLETSEGIQITIYTQLVNNSVQRNVFLWSDERFTLESQKALTPRRSK